MRRFFQGRAKTVVVVALLLSVALAVAASAFGVDVPGLLVKSVLKPLRAGMNALTTQAEHLYSYAFRYEALVAENEELKRRLTEMEDDARTADALARENERLRAAAQMQEQREDFKLVDANVIGWASNDWTSTFTINRDARSGIKVGQCVVTANQEVVGLITEVGTGYSVFKSVLDSSLEISATIASSGYNGMVQGGYATGLEGMLRMNYLPSDSIIRNHDQVVTAGSTVYPRDLVLGYVVDAGFDETGVTKFAVLEPAADLGALEQVFVLTEFAAE